jgi:hypothetical protein
MIKECSIALGALPLTEALYRTQPSCLRHRVMVQLIDWYNRRYQIEREITVNRYLCIGISTQYCYQAGSRRYIFYLPRARSGQLLANCRTEIRDYFN